MANQFWISKRGPCPLRTKWPQLSSAHGGDLSHDTAPFTVTLTLATTRCARTVASISLTLVVCEPSPLPSLEASSIFIGRCSEAITLLRQQRIAAGAFAPSHRNLYR